MKPRAIVEDFESKELKQECCVSAENELTGLARCLDEISSKYRFLKCPFTDLQMRSLLRNGRKTSFPVEMKSQESSNKSMYSNQAWSNSLPSSNQDTQLEMPLLVRRYRFNKNRDGFNYLREKSYSVKMGEERCYLIVKDELITVYEFEDFFKTMALVIQN